MPQSLAQTSSYGADAPPQINSQTKTDYPASPLHGSPLTASPPNPRVAHTPRISSARAKSGATSRSRRPRFLAMTTTTSPQRQRNRRRGHHKGPQRWKWRQKWRPRLESRKLLLENGCPSPRPHHSPNDPGPPQFPQKKTTPPPPPRHLSDPLQLPR